MDAKRTGLLVSVGMAVCLALSLGGQAATDALAADASGSDMTNAVGRAASSYLTGVRTFAAAALWNRLDPLLHNYYEGVPLEDQRYMMSTIAAVEWLDPTLDQPYYVGAWVLAANDKMRDGIAMAERGVTARPDSGLLWVNLAQVKMLFGRDLSGAVKAAERALKPGVKWEGPAEKHDGYVILSAVFRAAGRTDLDAVVQAELTRLDAEEPEALTGQDHDHDGDGKQDH